MSYQKIIPNGGYKDWITAEPHQRCYQESKKKEKEKIEKEMILAE